MKLGVVTSVSAFPASSIGAEVVPGYLLTARLGEGSSGEVWDAEGPGGFAAALKFIRLVGGPIEADLRALEILRSVHHPNVLTTFASFFKEDWLILAMERADSSLCDRAREAVAAGAPGIPREELIEQLSEAARGIDYLNRSCHACAADDGSEFQHGDIKPQNLFIVGGGVKVGDVRSARRAKGTGGQSARRFTAEFAAPELLAGAASRHSDQYSLAMTYCQLRGGRLPFSGLAARDLEARRNSVPDLSMMEEVERPAVARALSTEPQARWDNCRDFLAALEADVRRSLVVPNELEPEPEPAPEFEDLAPSPDEPTAIFPLFDLDDAEPELNQYYVEVRRPGRRSLRLALAAVALASFGGLYVWGQGLLPAQVLTLDDHQTRPEAFILAPTPPALPPRDPNRQRVESLPVQVIDRLTESSDIVPVKPAKVHDELPDFRPIASAIVNRVADRVKGTVAMFREVARKIEVAAASSKTSIEEVRPPLLPAYAPSLELHVPTSLVTLHVGEPARIEIAIGGRGSSCGPVDLTFVGVPAPLDLRSMSIPAGEQTARMTIRAEAACRGKIRVVATSAEGRAEAEFEVVVTADAPPIPAPAAWPVVAPLAKPGMSVSPAHGARLRGDSHLLRGRADLAVAAYREARQLDASDATSALSLARALATSGALEESLSAFDDAIRLEPKSLWAYRGRGEVLQKKGDRSGALRDYSEALRIRPRDASLLNRRGLLLFSQGETYKAIADFDEAIGLNPKDAAFHFNRAWIYDRLGDTVEALAGYDRAIALDPKFVAAYRARAATHARRGDASKVKADLDEAARLEGAAAPTTPPRSASEPGREASPPKVVNPPSRSEPERSRRSHAISASGRV